MANKYKHLNRKQREIEKRNKMCLNKRQFETKADAYQKGQESYKCKYCGKYHRSGKTSKFISQIKKGD